LSTDARREASVALSGLRRDDVGAYAATRPRKTRAWREQTPPLTFEKRFGHYRSILRLNLTVPLAATPDNVECSPQRPRVKIPGHVGFLDYSTARVF
jgi:hypothetical protein